MITPTICNAMRGNTIYNHGGCNTPRKAMEPDAKIVIDDPWYNTTEEYRRHVCRIWTSLPRPSMCGHQIGSPVNATTSVNHADDAERRHVHGIVYDFVDINARVPKEHRKWKDDDGADV